MTADHLTWYSLGRVASFTGSGWCGRSGRILHSSTVTWVHLIVLIISQTRFIHHVSSSTIVWNVVKRLTIWSYVLHLSDGLGGRGHLQHEHDQWPGAGGQCVHGNCVDELNWLTLVITCCFWVLVTNVWPWSRPSVLSWLELGDTPPLWPLVIIWYWPPPELEPWLFTDWLSPALKHGKIFRPEYTEKYSEEWQTDKIFTSWKCTLLSWYLLRILLR